MSQPTRGEASREIHAPAARLYAMVSDLTRMGEWSPECDRVDWIDEPNRAGSRFVGRNRRGPFPWRTHGRVEIAEPGRQFSFVTLHRGEPATRWTYRFQGDDPTTVSESFEVLRTPPLFAILEATVLRNRQRELEEGIHATLGALARAVEDGASRNRN